MSEINFDEMFKSMDDKSLVHAFKSIVTTLIGMSTAQTNFGTWSMGAVWMAHLVSFLNKNVKDLENLPKETNMILPAGEWMVAVLDLMADMYLRDVRFYTIAEESHAVGAYVRDSLLETVRMIRKRRGAPDF